MKSRRRIATPEAQDYADDEGELQQGFATGEMGFGAKLHSSNFHPVMSQLGQERPICRMSGKSA